MDGKITAGEDLPLELSELLAALESGADAGLQDWRDAIACYLSGEAGWRDACQRLGGAFAAEGGSAQSNGKSDQ